MHEISHIYIKDKFSPVHYNSKEISEMYKRSILITTMLKM